MELYAIPRRDGWRSGAELNLAPGCSTHVSDGARRVSRLGWLSNTQLNQARPPPPPPPAIPVAWHDHHYAIPLFEGDQSVRLSVEALSSKPRSRHSHCADAKFGTARWRFRNPWRPTRIDRNDDRVTTQRCSD